MGHFTFVAEVVRAAAIYAVAGAAAGAVNSAIYGGNVGQGALYGAIGGAIGGAAGVAAAGLGDEICRITLTLASAGVTGGIMAELSGAKFSEGMLTAMLAAGMAYGMGKLAMEIEKNSGAHGIDVGEATREQANASLSVTEADKKYCLDLIFNESVENVRVIEHSEFARLHGDILATTRENIIYLNMSRREFWSDLRLVLHEYFHVIRQWNTGELTVGRYLWESLWHGYGNNMYEVAARNFARDNLEQFRNCVACFER